MAANMVFVKRMNFAPLPKTRRELEMTIVRCSILAGAIVLLLQVWILFAENGPTRQYTEETLGPFTLLLSVQVLCCSIVALRRRERFLGCIGLLAGVGSALFALLPIVLQEVIYN
jgi:hypothetical protein